MFFLGKLLTLLLLAQALGAQDVSTAPGKARAPLSAIPPGAFAQTDAAVAAKDGIGYFSSPAAGIAGQPFLAEVFRSFGFSRDGRHFLYLRAKGKLPGFSLYAYEPGAATDRLMSLDPVLNAAWSPAALRIAYMALASGASLTLRVRDFATGEEREIASGRLDPESLEWSEDGSELLYETLSPDGPDAFHRQSWLRSALRHRLDGGAAPAVSTPRERSARAMRQAGEPAAGAGYLLPFQGSAYLMQGGALFQSGACDGAVCQVISHKNLLGYGLDWQQAPEDAMGNGRILAAADGTVVSTYNTVTCNSVSTGCFIGQDNYSPSCNDPNQGAGNFVILAHTDGSYTLYAHLKSASVRVAPGQTVARGDWIADQGHSGSAGTYNNYHGCGDHLHFQRQTSAVIWGQSVATDFNELACSLSCGTAYVSGNAENRGPAPALTLVLAPKALTPGVSSSGNQVVLPAPAPPGGSVVALSSSDPATASVPPSVTVPAGASAATFTLSALSASPAAVVITATAGGSSVSDSLTVGGVGIALLQPPFSRVFGGTPFIGIEVALSAPAPPGGTVVTLGSSNPALTVPPAITIPAGATNIFFNAATSPVSASTTALLTAGAGGTSGSATLFIDPNSLKTLNTGTNPLGGGNTGTGTIVLNGIAPPGGAVVSLSSNSPAAVVPATVTVPAGFNVITYPISTSAVTVSTPAVVTATFAASTLSAGLTLNPIVLTAFTLNPATVIAGKQSSYNGLRLSYPAPPGGAAIAFTSSHPSVIPPATLTMAAGTTLSPNFAIQSADVPAVTSADVTASYAGVSLTRTFTVNPLVPVVLLINASAVGGGNSVVWNKVTLNSAALGAGANVQLTSSNPAVAAVPATLLIPPGATSALFTITTSTVAASTPVVVTATLNGASQTGNLTVDPIQAFSMTLPNISFGGGTSQANNRISLNYPAPPGGAVVPLSSSNPAVASVPAGVTVAQGALQSPAFVIGSTPVTAPTPVTITAAYGGATLTTVVTVNPPAVSSVALQSPRIAGGLSLTGSIVLNGPAPAGGAAVALSSSHPAIAPVPSSVTVAAGATSSPAFTIATAPTPASTVVTISATYGGVTGSAALTIDPTQVAALALSPAVIGSGNSTSANTVTLNGPAPSGGALVAISSSHPAIAVPPASVLVPAGATVSAPFAISTAAGQVSVTNAVITASYGGATRTATLTVNPIVLTALTLASGNAGGGGSLAANQVSISDNAVAPGVSIALASSNPAVATVPATVSISAGSKTALFAIATLPVAGPTPVTISATLGSVTLTQTLTVTPAALAALALATTRTGGGLPVNGNSLALNGPAPSGGAVVALSSSDPAAASVPASVTIPAGSTGPATFDIATYPVPSSRAAVISAAYGGVTRSVTLNVDPIVPTRISMTTSLGGGNSTASNLVVLSHPAPPAGLTLTLASANPAVAAVPPTVSVAAGQTTSLAFTISTFAVTAPTAVLITATLNGVAVQNQITVNPILLSLLTINPTSRVAGNPGTYNSVKLTSPAPPGGAVVALSSSDPAASVPATVTVAAGATFSPQFWISTSAVSVPTTATITATYAGSTRTGTFTVNPIVPASLTLGSSSVGGGNAFGGSKVTLNSKALAGGAVVALSSSDPSVTVPATVTIPQNSTAVLFNIVTAAVAAPVTATITATYNGVSRTANLTVNPIVPAAVTATPSTVTGGTSSAGRVSLNFATPAAATVALSSSNPAAAAVPGSVNVAAGQLNSPNFTIATFAVGAPTPVTITATYNGVAVTTQLNVQ